MTQRALRTVVSIAVLALANLAAEGPESARELGRRMFHGEAALRGRMVGHSQELPLDAARCTNCHTKLRGTSGPPRSLEDFGPALGASSLLTRLARRGGPPSRYELSTFCRVLRDSVDPAHVMLTQAMPRYTLTDRECEALWAFLTTP